MASSTTVLEQQVFKPVTTSTSTVWMYQKECTYGQYNKVKLYFENNGLSPFIGSYNNGVHTICIRKYSKSKFDRMEALLNL